MRLDIMVVAIVALALVVLGLALLGVAFRSNGDSFGKYIFMFGAFCAFLLAGMGGFAVGRPVIAWLGISDRAGLFVELGCFFVLLIAIGWGYDKLRNWWSS